MPKNDLHVEIAPVVHSKTVSLTLFPAQLHHRPADVLILIQSRRLHPEEFEAGEGREVEEPGALAGGRHGHSVDIVV